jgi:MscS family membrane protein
MNEFLQTNLGRLVEVVVALVVTIVVSFLERLIYRKIHPRLKTQKKNWLSAVVKAMHAPLQVFIWLAGIAFAVDMWTDFLKSSMVMSIYRPLREVGGLILALWFFSSFVTEIEVLLMSKKSGKGSIDKTTVRAIGQVLRAVLIFAGVMLILQSVFNVPMSGVMALAGGGGITIGFAAKDLIANFFGGLMIFLDRPFVIGDWIHIPEKNIEGDVEQIGWRLTIVRTFDKRPIYVPNSVFLSVLVETPSRMTNRRIKTTIGIRYDDAKKMPQLLEKVAEVIHNHPDIDHNRTKYINFMGFGSSALELYVSCYTIATRRVEYLNVQQDVFLKILDVIDKVGAQCAFPTTTLHVPEPIKIGQ